MFAAIIPSRRFPFPQDHQPLSRMNLAYLPRLSAVLLTSVVFAHSAEKPEVPDWALPGSSTHQQVPPPTDFHRATKTDTTPIGVFDGQSDVGGALVPGSASFDPATKTYTINSAGYNIWYTRDEFRFLWTKMSGDLSLAADIAFPKPEGYDDRKVVLIVRQDLDDDSKEIMAALHGAGLIHLAQRPQKNTDIKEDQRIAAPTDGKAKSTKTRIGIEKHGEAFTLYVGHDGQPMQKVGEASTLRFDEPFYVGIGFTSHLPVTSDTAVVSNVVFEKSAGKVK
jgi:hypothetical protein